MTAPAIVPVEVVITAVTSTPDREPVHVHYEGRGVVQGPLAAAHVHHTTRAALAARCGLIDAWTSAAAREELQAHLIEHGINAAVVPNVDPEPPAPVAE